MIEKTTLERLRSFKLRGFIDALIEQSQSENHTALSFDERLTLLVDCEHSRRQSMRLEQRLKDARISKAACVESIDFSVQRGLNKAMFLELTSANWLLNGTNLIVTGPTGAGKTFLVSALAHTLCIKGFSVRQERTHHWLAHFELVHERRRLPQAIAAFRKVPLLIFDEWMRDPISDADARFLMDLFDDRYRKYSCAFISQIPVASWHSRFSDPTIADAVLDRIVHHSVRLELSGESMRKRLSLQREETSLRSDNS